MKNLEIIPEHMQDGVRRWIDHGIMPGSFLTAVLSNDLKEACLCADDTNIHRLPDYMRFFYNFAPIECWGSPENVRKWAGAGGLKGLDDFEEPTVNNEII